MQAESRVQATSDGSRAPAGVVTAVLSKIDPYLRGAGRAAVDAVPQLEEPLRYARGLYAHTYVRAAAARHSAIHEAGIEPYELVEVPPDWICRVTEPMPVPRFRRLCVIEGGDWDERDRRFRETDVFQAFEAHFDDGVPWPETEFFDRVLREIDDGRAPWGCRSREDLEARCERLEELYETIREDGYQTQRELLDGETDDPIGSRRTARRARLINDEIAVDVGRDGEFLFADGRNRLAIAILLDLDAVPVLVLRRHERWQSFRDEIARRRRAGDALPEIARRHPDLSGPTAGDAIGGADAPVLDGECDNSTGGALEGERDDASDDVLDGERDGAPGSERDAEPPNANQDDERPRNVGRRDATD